VLQGRRKIAERLMGRRANIVFERGLAQTMTSDWMPAVGQKPSSAEVSFVEVNGGGVSRIACQDICARGIDFAA
jgi:hypothetical protein